MTPVQLRVLMNMMSESALTPDALVKVTMLFACTFGSTGPCMSGMQHVYPREGADRSKSITQGSVWCGVPAVTRRLGARGRGAASGLAQLPS